MHTASIYYINLVSNITSNFPWSMKISNRNVYIIYRRWYLLSLAFIIFWWRSNMLYHLNLTLNHFDFQQNIHQKVLVFFGDLKCVKFLFLFSLSRRTTRRNYWYAWRKWLNSVHCKILILTHNDTNVNTRGAMGVGFGLCISCGLEMVVRLDSLV